LVSASFTLRAASPEEVDLAFEIKRDAMAPYIIARWGWDEAFQREHHRRRWIEKPWQFICVGSASVGTVSIDWKTSHLQFGEFYIVSRQRGQGLGSRVLEGALRQADARKLETRLEILKWNPVRSLYERHGFRIVGEDDIHYFAVRQSGP
jgi:ribosomal protein S18 acetylase RimI-like enzyme